jgi:hypothetical protein
LLQHLPTGIKEKLQLLQWASWLQIIWLPSLYLYGQLI